MTDIATLATGTPGLAYREVIFELVQQYGGTIEAITDEEAFQALHAVAKMDGISVEPATAVAFAGLFKLIQRGTIKPDQTVVINCSGHTFPVEKHIVGDYYRDMSLTNNGSAPRSGRRAAHRPGRTGSRVYSASSSSKTIPIPPVSSGAFYRPRATFSSTKPKMAARASDLIRNRHGPIWSFWT
jgi:hypothetical protein